MAAQSVEGPLVVIVGPTASGKTDLAIRLAQQVDGEIICADSRTVYKGMDIGTAKPTLQEQAGVPHYGLDLVEPGERFTAADFQRYARQKMVDIWQRGKVVVMVGGTGLYVDSVIFDYEFGRDADLEHRAFLNSMSVEELQDYCKKNSIELPRNVRNKRHLIRTIELNGINHKHNSSIKNSTTVVGISTERDVLRQRIEVRTHKMFTQGVVEETVRLAKTYGWNSEAMTASIYRIIRRLQEGEIEEPEAVELFIRSDMRLAKRQMTWFKRNPFIYWSADREHLLAYCRNFTEQFKAEH